MKSSDVQTLFDERDIRAVISRFCRAIDRRDYDLLRTCFHPDATDHHGDYFGGVDGLVDFVSAGTKEFRSSLHLIANVNVELDGDSARTESYCTALARLDRTESLPERDNTVAFRYLDDFERRDGVWRIIRRVCVYEWTRTDPVSEGWQIPDTFRRGTHDRDDLSYTRQLPAPADAPAGHQRQL